MTADVGTTGFGLLHDKNAISPEVTSSLRKQVSDFLADIEVAEGKGPPRYSVYSDKFQYVTLCYSGIKREGEVSETYVPLDLTKSDMEIMQDILPMYLDELKKYIHWKKLVLWRREPCFAKYTEGGTTFYTITSRLWAGYLSNGSEKTN